jgi:hypothetical protein
MDLAKSFVLWQGRVRYCVGVVESEGLDREHSVVAGSCAGVENLRGMAEGLML